MIAFGPVPSRRLGNSLGVNNIPPKSCTYSCVYCQLGRTNRMPVERQVFYKPEEVLQAVRDKAAKARASGEAVDYLTFVPDGEPTLDVDLGREIDLLKPLGIRVAVITNASLVWREDVREALMKANWVSLKVDAVEEAVWRRINRPHGALRLASILEGTLAFGRSFEGALVTETMLVAGLNDDDEHLERLGDFLAELRPAAAYLTTPTRPPAEDWVQPLNEETIHRAYQTLAQRLNVMEYLIGYEGNAFVPTGNIREDLLGIAAVHPMREEAMAQFLAQAGADWSIVRQLVREGQLVPLEYQGRTFYRRRFSAGTGNVTVQLNR
jgi:wyosine [tRNA(Phe)-imidazoG37] synthetase (radical SAM superfamily)